VTSHFSSALELAAAIRAGATDSRSVTRLFLDRIERAPGLHAYVHVPVERALALADAADRLLAGGIVLSPLHGVPVAIKDSFAWEGTPLRGGSRTRDAQPSEQSSAVVKRLLAAGMVILGKTAMTEYAFGLSGQNQTVGTAKNPWDASGTRAPGGSSSGAGVAVAAGLAPIAVGGDTGGSVRAPALLNHLVGYKPSSGLISRAGCLPLSGTLDVVGPVARTVEDARALASILAGPDFDDPTTLVPPSATAPRPLKRRLAVLADDALPAPLQPEAERLWRDACARIGAAGWTLEPWRPGEALAFAQLGRDNSTVLSYEAFRFYGEIARDDAQPLWSVIRARIRGGGDVTEAQYRSTLERRSEVMRAFADAMRPFDALLLPGADQAAQPLDSEDTRHLGLGAYLRPANFLGAAAIALPAARDRDGMPWGIQVIAPAGEDPTLLEAAAEIERALGAGRPHPDLGGWHLS
jgi:aspartyl-tRNA(Asn)/glutamyl-tRNA(Gln) amidotransferase subunit A